MPLPSFQQVTLHFFSKEVMRLRTAAGGQAVVDSFFDLEEVMAEGLAAEPDLGDFLIELQLWKVRATALSNQQYAWCRPNKFVRKLTPAVVDFHCDHRPIC